MEPQKRPREAQKGPREAQKGPLGARRRSTSPSTRRQRPLRAAVTLRYRAARRGVTHSNRNSGGSALDARAGSGPTTRGTPASRQSAAGRRSPARHSIARDVKCIRIAQTRGTTTRPAIAGGPQELRRAEYTGLAECQPTRSPRLGSLVSGQPESLGLTTSAQLPHPNLEPLRAGGRMQRMPPPSLQLHQRTRRAREGQ